MRGRDKMKDKKSMCDYASCVAVKCVCAGKHVVAARATRERVHTRVGVCVSPRKRGGCFFLPSFFHPLFFLLVSPTVYPTPLFSIFTCSSRCEGSEILNYRNALVSAKTTQPLLSPDLKRTFSHFHCHRFDPPPPPP